MLRRAKGNITNILIKGNSFLKISLWVALGTKDGSEALNSSLTFRPWSLYKPAHSNPVLCLERESSSGPPASLGDCGSLPHLLEQRRRRSHLLFLGPCLGSRGLAGERGPAYCRRPGPSAATHLAPTPKRGTVELSSFSPETVLQLHLSSPY